MRTPNFIQKKSPFTRAIVGLICGLFSLILAIIAAILLLVILIELGSEFSFELSSLIWIALALAIPACLVPIQMVANAWDKIHNVEKQDAAEK